MQPAAPSLSMHPCRRVSFADSQRQPRSLLPTPGSRCPRVSDPLDSQGRPWQRLFPTQTLAGLQKRGNTVGWFASEMHSWACVQVCAPSRQRCPEYAGKGTHRGEKKAGREDTAGAGEVAKTISTKERLGSSK